MGGEGGEDGRGDEGRGEEEREGGGGGGEETLPTLHTLQAHIRVSFTGVLV